MAGGMAPYEAAIAPVKAQLFDAVAGADDVRTVVELGIGTFPNARFLAGKGVRVVGIDPNPAMGRYSREAAARWGVPLQLLQGSAEALPLLDASADAVVCTLVLCSVSDVRAVLAEVRRVLRPGGRFVFIEHVLAPEDARLQQLCQRLLDPLQRALADGCHLTRRTLGAIRGAGFASVDAREFQVEGMSLIAPHVAGTATAPP